MEAANDSIRIGPRAPPVPPPPPPGQGLFSCSRGNTASTLPTLVDRRSRERPRNVRAGEAVVPRSGGRS